MKRILVLFVTLLAISPGLCAQTNAPVPDDRLLAVFDADHLEKLRTESPLQLHRYNYYLDNGWFIVDIPAGKEAGALQFPVVHIEDPEHLNIFVAQRELALKRVFDRPTYYRLEGTDKVLVLRAEKTFARMFDAERRKRGF